MLTVELMKRSCGFSKVQRLSHVTKGVRSPSGELISAPKDRRGRKATSDFIVAD